MNILIFGASGFIGHACYTFFSIDHQVTGIDVQNKNNPNITIDLDFSKSKTLIQSGRFDVIINCAGSSNIQQSFTNPELDYDLNTRYVEKILICLNDYSAHTKFINLSSAAVYGNPDSIPISESQAIHPLSPYGKNKLSAEKIIHSFAINSGLKGLSCRIFSAYGIGLKRQFFYDLSTKFLQQPEQITLQGTGRESRDFIYISDIIAGLNVLIDKASFGGEVYNLANGIEVFIDEAAQLYSNLFGYTGQINYSQKQFEGYPLNWQADISKIKALGFEPKISLQSGLSFYSDWIKRNFNA